MVDIALFYMSDYKFGGFPAFTQHLHKSFKVMGYDPAIYKIRQRSEAKERYFGAETYYRNVSIGEALEIVRCCPSIITATEYKRDEHGYIDALLKAGAGVVIHDWTEMDRGFDDILLELEIRVVSIRSVNVEMLASYGVESVFIQHPYISAGIKPGNRHMRAVSLSRLDWDKNNHIIVEANTVVSPRNVCYMWGSKYNRFFLKDKIYDVFPGWESRRFTGPYYMGPHLDIPNFPVWMASNADFVVDMSVIKGDGGGTQYCFLEAIDGGAVLVLNSDWILDGGLFQHDYNCIAVSSADELADVLEYTTHDDYKDVLCNAGHILENHVPQVVIPQYLDYLGVS